MSSSLVVTGTASVAQPHFQKMMQPATIGCIWNNNSHTNDNSFIYRRHYRIVHCKGRTFRFLVLYPYYNSQTGVPFCVCYLAIFFYQVCWSVAFVCLSVCLSHDFWPQFKQSFWNVVAYAGDWPRTETHIFGEDLHLDTGALKVILHHWEVGPKTIYCIAQYLKRLWTD